MAELGPSVVVVADRDVPGGLGVSFDGDCHMLCFSRSEMVSSTGLQCRVCEKENGIRKAKEVGKEKACGITDDTLYILYSSGTVSGGSQKPVYGSISVLMNRLKWQACEIPWRSKGMLCHFTHRHVLSIMYARYLAPCWQRNMYLYFVLVLGCI